MSILIIYALIIAAIGFILVGILGILQAGAKRPALPQANTHQTRKIKPNLILSFTLPFAQRFMERFKLDVKMKNRLDAAHINLSAREFFNLKIIIMLLLTIFAPVALGKFEPPVFLVALALGYILPDIWLSRKINQRKYAIARLIPETVDLLGLCVEGGLDFTSAVKWIIEKTTPNPLIEELAFVLEEIKWGKPRTQALRDMSTRLSIPEVSSFVQTLVQAERMGTPVAEAFAILSEDTRLQRFHRGERYAMQAPIKILIPLIFCILPVIGIVIGGPILLQFMQGGLLTGFGK